MYRIKLMIVAVALAGLTGLLFISANLTPNAEAAQGKKGQKPKKSAKPAPTPKATPVQIKAAPKPMPPAPPSAGDTPNSSPTLPLMVKPPTAAETPGSLTPTPMVKPPTATETPQPLTPATTATPEKPQVPASGGANSMMRKGPKPPDGNVLAIVGVKGKPVPYASKEEPVEPLLFSTDNDARFIAKAAFDHTKHSKDANYSVNGKAPSTCVECHHTDQAATSPGVPSYYKLFERDAVLTSALLSGSNQPVSSCRVCHLSSREPEIEGYPPEGVAYPDGESDKRDVYADKQLKSEIAYHINCIVCHERSKQARPTYQFKFLPASKCTDCHYKAS